MSKPLSAPLAGVLLAAGAAVAFSLTDLIIKSMSADYALHQIMMIRGITGLGFILAYAATSAEGFKGVMPQNFAIQGLRSLIILISNVCYFTGLTLLPFADAAAIAYISPLVLTVLSIFFLGEKVGPRRWAAILIGFVGITMMLRPSGGVIHPAALLVLISAVLYAVGYLMTRKMRDSESAISMTVWMQIAFILLSLAVGLAVGDGRYEHSSETWSFLLRAWGWPSMQDWVLFALSGLGTAIGSVMITQAFRIAEAGLVAPMEYIGMPLAILWGTVFFGTWPDLTSWLGIFLICGSGLYIIWRETRVKKESAP